jgi:prepilin-type processing-associated H-X9-DG protein
VQCLSNLKQLANATISFANDKKGVMPAQGGTSPQIFTSDGRIKTWAAGDDLTNAADWIAWHRSRDPLTNVVNSNALNQNITYSGLAPYLGASRVDHATPQEANAVNPTLESVFRCPSDELLARPNADTGGRGAYRYSYSINQNYTSPRRNVAGYPAGQRVDGVFTGKITSIRNPSEKVLFVCEDEQTIDDGVFAANPAQWDPSFPGYSSGRINAVSSRHTSRATARSLTLSSLENKDSLGNVAFADGHAEFFSRKDALRQKHSGSPVPDPAGF